MDTAVPMTSLQWDTLFSRISNTIDNLPIARGDTSNETSLGYEIITPNRLKLGRNNYRSLAGKIQISGGQAVLRKKVETEFVYGYLKDDWRQVPAKIMFGNGVSWTCLISLGLEVDERYQYIMKEMVIQPEILDLIRDLPVVTGLAI